MSRSEGKTHAPIYIRAPAKLNLTLAVRGLREDGYHEIESWTVKTDLHDEIRLSAAARIELTVTGDCVAVPGDGSNLVIRAAQALADATGVDGGAHIVLDKRIPTQAGLGGGSSDAAATLCGLNQLWRLNLPVGQVLRIAAMIGSDVPLFLMDAPVVVRGRGERVDRAPISTRYWAGLVLPGFGLATADVYRALDQLPAPVRRNDEPWTTAWPSAQALSERLFNDLTPAAIAVEPRLGALIERVGRAGGERVHMTGSGSGLFALFDGRDAGRKWGDKVAAVLDEHERHIAIRTIC